MRCSTPLEDIYVKNAPTLRKIRDTIDPEDVMSLAGGVQGLVPYMTLVGCLVDHNLLSLNRH
jgi:hypothetical protein